MIAQSLVEKKILKVQSHLFDLFMTETPYTFDQFIVNLSGELSSLVDARFSCIYFLDDWKGYFRLYSANLDKGIRLREHFSRDDIVYHGSSNTLNEKEIERLVFKEETSMKLSITPLHSGQMIFGFLILGFEQLPLASKGTLLALSDEVTKCVKKFESFYTTLEEKKKYELLYKVTSQFHSSIDMDGVLKEIIATLRKVYPEFRYYLLLSQDYTTDHDLPVKELNYDKDPASKASTQAYLTGEVQMEDRRQEKQSILYAPLKGKQGIYGVLQVIAPSYLYFPKKDFEFFILIANTAGNALENAQLYQQSRKLNNDLQLINATSQKLNSTTRLPEKISYMASKINESFKADEVGFITFNENGGYTILEGSSEYFTSGNSGEFIGVISDKVVKQKDALFLGDLKTKKIESTSPFRSLMAVPMTEHEHISGLAVVLHKDAYSFTFESFKLLQSLVHHSTLAFANSMLREELEGAVITDYLTKLHSRIYLDQCVETHVQYDQTGQLILFDIDNFKNVNDTYGHQVGDEVICQVADLIQSIIEGVGLAARWGGEELAVYLPSISTEKAYELAELIRRKVSKLTTPSVTVSCGLASWEASCKRPDRKEIVQRADQALYKAKESGKDKIVIASPYRTL